MGYNPYICILCKKVEDNGWAGGDVLFPHQRCNLIVERLELKDDPRKNRKRREGSLGKFARGLNRFEECGYDVCDKCFRKGPPVRDPFFAVKRSKSERRTHFLSASIYSSKFSK